MSGGSKLGPKKIISKGKAGQYSFQESGLMKVKE